MVRAVASHADYLEVSRDTPMEKTLYAVDELSGFVMACAYVRPQGIDGLTPKSVKKKMKTPAFAAAVDRAAMREGAELLGVDFDEHVTFVVAALEPHAEELGLAGVRRSCLRPPRRRARSAFGSLNADLRSSPRDVRVGEDVLVAALEAVERAASATARGAVLGDRRRPATMSVSIPAG